MAERQEFDVLRMDLSTVEYLNGQLAILAAREHEAQKELADEQRVQEKSRLFSRGKLFNHLFHTLIMLAQVLRHAS